MANIKINDLQPAEFEFSELSYSELELIVGGGIIGRIWEQIKRTGRQIDSGVRKNISGGWGTVFQTLFSWF